MLQKLTEMKVEIASNMLRCTTRIILIQSRYFSGISLGGAEEILHFSTDEFGGRKRKKPETFKKKLQKESVTPFKETTDADGFNETRRIRTRPRRRDYTSAVDELKRSVSWDKEMVTLGKYVEFPKYDPLRLDREGNIDLECLPDTLEFENPFTREVEKIDFSILPTDPEDSSKASLGWCLLR